MLPWSKRCHQTRLMCLVLQVAKQQQPVSFSQLNHKVVNSCSRGHHVEALTEAHTLVYMLNNIPSHYWWCSMYLVMTINDLCTIRLNHEGKCQHVSTYGLCAHMYMLNIIRVHVIRTKAHWQIAIPHSTQDPDNTTQEMKQQEAHTYLTFLNNICLLVHLFNVF